MDNLTHTLVGVGMAQAFFRRRVPEAVLILALASNLPDVDALVHLSGDPISITLRRSFGHSLLTIPLLSAGLAMILKRRYPRTDDLTLFGLCLLGAMVHFFFDLVNSFGILPLWPASPWRPELSMVFIIDLTLLGLLAAPFLICWPRPLRGHLQALCRLSLALAAAYLLFCAINRSLAETALERQARALRPDFSYLFPEPLGPHRWRGVLRRGNIYKVYLIRSLDQEAEFKRELATDLRDPSVERVRQTPEARRLEGFFKAPVWSARKESGGSATVRVFDLRFQPLLIERGRPFEFAFRVQADGRVERL